MKVSTSLSVQYDNPFSPFPGKDWKQGLDWVRDSGFDAVEIILSGWIGIWSWHCCLANPTSPLA